MRASSFFLAGCLGLASCALAACGSDSTPPSTPGTDAGSRSDGGTTPDRDTGTPPPPVDAGPPMDIAGGDVSGAWCGAINVLASVTVPAGETLEVCAGSVVSFADGAGMTVAGTLRVNGEAGARVRFGPSGSTWTRIDVMGTMEAAFIDIVSPIGCINGGAASMVHVTDATLSSCPDGVSLLNGGTFERVVATQTVFSSRAGTLSMTDVDVAYGDRATDNITVGGGTLFMDHVRSHDCHCSIHVNGADAVMMTASILDEASVPVMIQAATGAFHGNHLLAGSPTVDDIGGGTSGIELDVGGNYWGGGAPNIGTRNDSQFLNATDYLADPIAGVGPR